MVSPRRRCHQWVIIMACPSCLATRRIIGAATPARHRSNSGSAFGSCRPARSLTVCRHRGGGIHLLASCAALAGFPAVAASGDCAGRHADVMRTPCPAGSRSHECAINAGPVRNGGQYLTALSRAAQGFDRRRTRMCPRRTSVPKCDSPRARRLRRRREIADAFIEARVKPGRASIAHQS